jgi:glycosyltransferase involved in cell wall biosynthesis
MRVAIITPFYLQATRGNAVTVRRIEHSLQKIGCVTAVFSLDQLEPAALSEAVRSFSPDIISAFHAVRCGSLTAQIAADQHLPYIITITGTELYQGGGQALSAADGLTLHNAAALVVFHEVIGGRVKAALPALADRLKIIPQGVEAPENLSADELPAAPFTFFLPAGIRPVKNILFPFQPLAELSCRYPQIRLVIAGPAIDAEYASQLLAAVAANSFSSWGGEIECSAMPAYFRAAQVVLNTSLSEGGMANSILEGMAYAKPILAADIEGNRSLVSDGVNGLLYSSYDDFIDKAKRLLLDESLRKRLGAAGRAYVLENCSSAKEAASYLELYSHIIAFNKGV